MTGAVRRLYDMDGVEISSLDELSDCTCYIATGGDNLRKVAYVTVDENGFPIPFGSVRNLATRERRSNIESARRKRKNNRSNGGLLLQDPEFEQPPAEQPLFSPTVNTSVFLFVFFSTSSDEFIHYTIFFVLILIFINFIFKTPHL